MPGLKGTSILLVEDVVIIALELAEVLREAGCKVVGPVGTLSEALAAVNRSSFDGAVIDVNLHGENAFPIMEALEEAALPFVIVTGYCRDQLPAPLPPSHADCEAFLRGRISGRVGRCLAASTWAEGEVDCSGAAHSSSLSRLSVGRVDL